jgi:NitT/TauT family transport system substrate-binding protein
MVKITSIGPSAALVVTLALLSPSLSSAAEKLEKVIVGTVASISDAGIYIAIAKGYFKEQGIELDIPVFDSGSNQIGMLAGGTPAAGLFNAFAQGINVRVVADKGTHTPGHGYIAFLVRKELSAQVKRIEDLKKLDKPRFTINASGGSGAEAQLRQLLRMAGIDHKSAEIKIVPYPQIPAALASNSIDIGQTLEPYATKAIEQGMGTKLVWIDDFRPNDIGGVLMYGEQFHGRVPQSPALLPQRLSRQRCGAEKRRNQHSDATYRGEGSRSLPENARARFRRQRPRQHVVVKKPL